MSSDKEHIDDIFKNHFEDYEPTPAGNVWSRVKSGLGNNSNEETLYSKFDKHQPQPPAWVWASLSNILKGRQRINLYKRIAAASLFFITLGGLIASQFAANSAIDSLFSFENDDNVFVKTRPIKPVIEQQQFTNHSNLVSHPTPKNYLSYNQTQPTIKNIISSNAMLPVVQNVSLNNNSILLNNEMPVIALEVLEIQVPEIPSLESIFVNASVPALASGIPNFPQNNFNYKAPRYKKPSNIETYIEIFGGVSNTFRNLDSKLDANVASIRKESEKASNGTQWGIKFNIIKNNLSFTNGLTVSQYNYTGTYAFQTQDIVNIHPYFSTNNPKAFIQEDYFDTVNQNKNKNVLTTYKFISLNTSVGYVINASKRISIIPTIGVSAGYLLRALGPKLNAGKPTEYAKMVEANSLSLNQRMMISSAIALKVNFKLCTHFKLGVEPYMSSQINKQETTSPLGGQQLTAKGVNLSLSYKF